MSQLFRVTNQQEATLQALNNGEHLSAQEVFLRVQKQLPRTGRATIYRQLEQLCTQGKIRKVATEEGITRFELMTQKKEHDHFICQECGAIMDITLNEVRQIIKKKYPEEGILINITGTCDNCKKEHIGDRT